MDARDARRLVCRHLSDYAHLQAADPGVIGDPDDRARMVEAYRWIAAWLAPPEVSVLAANLRPLVTPSGTPPDGAPAEWSARHDEPDRREDPLSA